MKEARMRWELPLGSGGGVELVGLAVDEVVVAVVDVEVEAVEVEAVEVEAVEVEAVEAEVVEVEVSDVVDVLVVVKTGEQVQTNKKAKKNIILNDD